MVASWLDWWLSTCGGFQESTGRGCSDFDQSLLAASGSLEFLASQVVTTVGDLVLSRHDSFLDFALSKMRAMLPTHLFNTLHPPRLPWKTSTGVGSARSSTAGSAQACTSGATRPARKRSSVPSPSGQSGKERESGTLLPSPAPRYRSRRTGQVHLGLWPCGKGSRRCLPKEPWKSPSFRILAFPVVSSWWRRPLGADAP